MIQSNMRSTRKEADALFVDRFVATPMFYPVNYGYVPGTLSEDGDALDAQVVSPYPVVPGSVIRCRPIGILKMTDDGGPDSKLIARSPHRKLTTLYNHGDKVEALPDLFKRQIEHYFENYKDLEEGKWVKIEGWGDADDARGPQAGRKVFTLQTLPACDPEDQFGDTVGKVAGSVFTTALAR